MFGSEIFSLMIKQAKNGVKTGIVAIINAPTVEETNCMPKLSPRKQRNGSKNASKKIYFQSFLSIVSLFLNRNPMANNMKDARTSRIMTSESGLQQSSATLYQTKERLQHPIAKTAAMYILTRCRSIVIRCSDGRISLTSGVIVIAVLDFTNYLIFSVAQEQ